MIMSEEKQTKLYTAIHEPIMTMRIKNRKVTGGDSLDDQLFNLNADIWAAVKLALNFKE